MRNLFFKVRYNILVDTFFENIDVSNSKFELPSSLSVIKMFILSIIVIRNDLQA